MLRYRLVEHLEQAIANSENFAITCLELGGTRRIEQALPQRQRDGSFLLEIAQELPVQGPGVPKILAHPLGRSSRQPVAHTEREF